MIKLRAKIDKDIGRLNWLIGMVDIELTGNWKTKRLDAREVQLYFEASYEYIGKKDMLRPRTGLFSIFGAKLVREDATILCREYIHEADITVIETIENKCGAME